MNMDPLDMDPFAGFHAQFAIEFQRSALLVIDMQYATGSRLHGFGRFLEQKGRSASGRWRFDRIEKVVIPNLKRLLEFYRENHGQVVYLTLGSEVGDFTDIPKNIRALLAASDNRVGAPNHEILEEVHPTDGELVINKTTSSAFLSTDLDSLLRKAGVNQLLLTGISTNSCVENTGRNAIDLGYDCLLVEDACSCANEETHIAAVSAFGRVRGRTVSTHSVVEEMLRYDQGLVLRD